jgi:hypothetical protein
MQFTEEEIAEFKRLTFLENTRLTIIPESAALYTKLHQWVESINRRIIADQQLNSETYKNNIADLIGCWPSSEHTTEDKRYSFSLCVGMVNSSDGLRSWEHIENPISNPHEIRVAPKPPLKASDLEQYNFGIFGRALKIKGKHTTVTFQRPVTSDTKRIAQDSPAALINDSYWFVDDIEEALKLFNDYFAGKKLRHCAGVIGQPK